jgi:hypothetical protein
MSLSVSLPVCPDLGSATRAGQGEAGVSRPAAAAASASVPGDFPVLFVFPADVLGEL